MPKMLLDRQLREGGLMNIIHIMADGSVRDSVEGVVIQSEEFYRVLQGVIERQSKE